MQQDRILLRQRRGRRAGDKGDDEDSHGRFDAYELDEDDALELPRFS